MENSSFHHRMIDVNGTSSHVVEIGSKEKTPVLFLHGFPENWGEFKKIMTVLKDDYYLLAIDLPGIGRSEAIRQFDKLAISAFVKELLHTMNLQGTVLVGHDVGGMITYSFTKNFGEVISKAVVIGTSIPGVSPWEEVKRNPYIWHFSFFSIPDLPEQLISGKQGLLFEYFYHTLSYNKQAITEDNKKAYIESYQAPDSLKTALGWYRTFSQDEKQNKQSRPVDTPVLYLKGSEDHGVIADYVNGFKENGLVNVIGRSIPDSGHFVPEENPEFTARAIHEFIKGGY